MLQVKPLALEFFVDRLTAFQPFAFARYGDGEFNAILGTPGENCDGHIYFTGMGTELAETLIAPRWGNYIYAIGPKAARKMQGSVSRWLARYAPKLQFHTSETFVNASLTGDLLPLMEALRSRQVLIVGGAHLRPVATYLNARLLIAPRTNAWLRKADLKQQIENSIGRTDVVLFSAGMVSKILIWELFPAYRSHMLWDTGSLFDMYCGRDSRSYARRMEAAEKVRLMRMNFGVTL